MIELYVVRHGIAVPPGTPGMPDDQRPLTAQGEKRCRQVGRALRRLGIQPERIVTSPLPRAIRTAEILAEALRLPESPEVAEALHANQDAGSIHELLRGRSESRLMIVGHNPALSQLVGLLLTGSPQPGLCELGKAGVAALSGEHTQRMTLDWLATSRLLKKIE